MRRDVQNYTAALNFGVETSAGRVELLLPQQASPGVTSPAGISPGVVTPEVSSPSPAPTSASATSRATNACANRDAVRVTPGLMRSRAASLLPVPVAARYEGGCNNNRATLAELSEAGTLQRLSKLELDRRAIRRTSHTRRRTPLLT